MSASALSLAWAAGLYEGEGSCGTWRSRSGGCPKLQLQMTDEDVVRRFHSVIGFGGVHGPYQYKANKKPFWVWSATGFKNVQAAIAMFWSFLGGRRREQAKKALLIAREQIPRPSVMRVSCLHGHPYTGRNARGDQVCVECQRAACERYRRKRGAKPRSLRGEA